MTTTEQQNVHYHYTPAPPKKTHRFRNFVVFPVVGLIALVAIISAASGGSKSASAKPTGASVSKGLGARDASADVTLGAVPAADAIGVTYVPVTVTNHSSKRSNYIIDVQLENPAGVQIGDDPAVILNNVDSGQQAISKAMFTDNAPTGSHAVIKSVQRTASV